LVHLNIFRGSTAQGVLTDSNSGNARIIIAKSKGGN
jgi:hypothetical protein